MEFFLLPSLYKVLLIGLGDYAFFGLSVRIQSLTALIRYLSSKLACLLLQLINQILHPLGVLAILILPELVLLDLPLGLAVIFHGIAKPALFTIKFALELLDPVLQLGNHFASPFESILLRKKKQENLAYSLGSILG